jgi:hypothetical protein
VKKILGIALLLSVGASGLAIAQKKPSETPVTTIVSDYDSGIAPALEIQSDQLGAYNNSSTLKSIIATTGVWYLDSLNPRNATRRVTLRFTNPIPGSGPNGGDPVAPASGGYLAFAYTSCNHPNYQSSLLTLPAGQTMPCPMVVQFAADGRSYYLHMNDRGVDFPQTNHVNITCIFPTSGTSPCSQWVIRPSGSGVLPDGTPVVRNVANLSYSTTVRGQTTWVNQGDFYMSFSIIVTK